MKNKAKSTMLFLDIETSPSLGYVWGKWEQNVLEFEKEWHIMSFSVKDIGKKASTYALPDYKVSYKKDKEDDKELMKVLWKYLDTAEIVCAHNGKKFDMKKINSRFVYHGLPLPSPYKVVDTLQEARKHFGFTSNKLDDLGRYLKIGRKLSHTGFKLWLDCLKGDMKAWATMKRYNEQDVILLEKLYKRLLPYMNNHPPAGMYNGKPMSCPNCGSGHVQRRGIMKTRTNIYQRFQCQDCGAWSKSTKSEKTLTKPLVGV